MDRAPQYLPEHQMGDWHLPLVGKMVPAARAGRYGPGMRRSIATVSLSGTLNEKLTAVANAGFDGVEIFDQDLLCSLWTPRRIKERCDELGLKIEMLQPFRDLEGMTEAQHARTMRRFEGKLDIMAELGTDLVLVCASCQPDAIDDDHLSAQQLRRAAELAHERGMRIAFEALAWSTHVWDYRRAWKIVRMADHPALGTCQDTFHVLSRRLDPWAIRDIPGEKIFFVQLSDAPEMAMDILQWSRHHRVWPGQGSWDVVGFLENCLVAGYTGPLSLEIFNTVFRRADAERNARDALRSLLYVEDAVAHRGSMPPGSLDSAPPAPRVTGLEFVELGVLEQQPSISVTLTALGFRHTRNNRDKPIELWEQGNAKILLNTSAVGRGGQRGPHIAALSVGTPDPAGAFERGAYLHATVSAPGRGPAEAANAAIEAPDGTAVFFSRLAEHPERWGLHYDPVSGASGGHDDLDLRVDHVSLAQPFDNFEEAALFFKSALGLQTHEDIEIPATYGLFRSRAVSNDDRSVRVITTVALLDDDAGVTEDESRKNSLAFEVPDIFDACERVWARGGELLRVGHNYYVDLASRTDFDAATLERMERLGILYDEIGSGKLLQAFTPMIGNRLFFELCQRIDGYDSYGTANAPVRISAHRGVTLGLRTKAVDED
jgi:4-hydroxyphenylpyruvate dioxygenase